MVLRFTTRNLSSIHASTSEAMATEIISQLRTVEATINYFPPNGPTRINPGTAGYQRRKFDSKIVDITDVRGAEDDFNLDKNGFQKVKNMWTTLIIR